MIKKTIFICCERVEKAKKVLSDFVEKEYLEARTANADHDLVNKAGLGAMDAMRSYECRRYLERYRR